MGLQPRNESEDRGHDGHRTERDGEEVALHLVHPILHTVEPCIHAVEPVLHTVEPCIHAVEMDGEERDVSFGCSII